MLAAEVCIAIKPDLVCEFGTACVGKFAEQAPGGGVVLGDGGFHELDTAANLAVNDMVEHAQSEALSARSAADRDLPYENRVGAFWHEVTRDRADNDAIKLGDDRGVAKVGALQQIAVEGVGVQWRTICYELVDRRAVCRDGLPEARKPFGAIRFIRCNDYTPSRICRVVYSNAVEKAIARRKDSFLMEIAAAILPVGR